MSQKYYTNTISNSVLLDSSVSYKKDRIILTLFFKENLEVDIMFYGGEMLGMNLPDKIAMKVVHTEPGVKGNTTSTAMKDAELETGLVIKVPMFIDQDEIVLISSKDGKYVSRA